MTLVLSSPIDNSKRFLERSVPSAFVALSLAFWGWSGVVSAQDTLPPAVIEGDFEVRWLPKAAEAVPVGFLSPVDAFWLDEIPWNVHETAVPLHWEGIQDLVTQEAWVAVDSMDLTNRQRMLLRNAISSPGVQWSFLETANRKIAQIETPLIRFNTSRSLFERLEMLTYALGQGQAAGLTLSDGGQTRARSWPSTSVLGAGEFVRISIPAD